MISIPHPHQKVQFGRMEQYDLDEFQPQVSHPCLHPVSEVRGQTRNTHALLAAYTDHVKFSYRSSVR
jgi:hypothetical protein